MGTNPTVWVIVLSTSELIRPWATGRSESEIPSRMLRVARVAIIEGSFTQRTSNALNKPINAPAPRIASAAEQNHSRRCAVRDDERGDDHANGHDRTDRDVEIANEHRIHLRHRRQRQREGDQQQTVQIVRTEMRWNAKQCNRQR